MAKKSLAEARFSAFVFTGGVWVVWGMSAQVRLDLLEASHRREAKRLTHAEGRADDALGAWSAAAASRSPGSPGRKRTPGGSALPPPGAALPPVGPPPALTDEAAAAARDEEAAWASAEASRARAWENLRLAARSTFGGSGHRRDDAAAVEALQHAAQEALEGRAPASPAVAGPSRLSGAAGLGGESFPPAAARHAMALLGLRASLGVGLRPNASAALQWFGAAASGEQGDTLALVRPWRA
jgi:hypothetical protein